MSRSPRLRLPSPLTLFLVGLAAVGVALAFLKGLQDPDYFWHLETGELIAERGLPSADPYSFAYDGPWVLHEWLGQLLIHGLDRLIGPVGSLVVFGLMPPAAIAILSLAARRLGLGNRSIVLAAILAGGVLVPYVTVRPQVLSWVLLAVLVAVLLEARPGRMRALAAVPPFFVLWANLHGLYVVGLGVLALFCVLTLLGRTAAAPRRLHVAAAGLLAFAGSALTPAGPAGLLYPLRYVDAGDWGLANIPEWQSPNFHDAVQLPLLVLVVALAALGRGRAPGWVAAVGYLGIAGALLANRNAPVAAVAAFVVLAAGIDAALAGRRPSGGSVPTDLGRRAVESGIVVALVAAVLLLLPSLPGAAGVSHERYPAAAVAAINDGVDGGRIVAEYGWAGYVIRHLADDGWQVLVDGRNDMYPEATLRDYSAIRDASDGWAELLDRHRADALLFPPDAPIVRGIAQDAGWCERYRDDRQVLLTRCST